MIDYDEDIVVDGKKVKNIRSMIYIREIKNIKLQAKKDSEMIDDIKKVIEKEVEKCY